MVITLCVVVAITVFVIFMIQLLKTAKEGEEILKKVRELIANLNETSQKVNAKIEDLGAALEATKKTAINISEIAALLTMKIIKPSSRYWPLLFPLLRFAWRLIKKRRKEDKHGK